MEKTLQKTLQLLHRYDLLVFGWCMERKHLAVLARIARSVSRTADGYGYPALALLAWWLGGERGAAFMATLALAFGLERPLYWTLKNGLRRNRPSSVLPGYNSFIIPSDQFSFPSGHTSGAFLTATALALFYPGTAPLGFTWAVLVAGSRVTLGVHFPTDTLAGALMGTTLAWCAAVWIT
jgi:undecaprenyl-diphosphatase